MGSTKEIAGMLRAEYKRIGWGSKDIGVRISLFSMGSSIDVRVRSPRVDIGQARKLAEECERIDRDHFGEILGGANRYVHFAIEQSVRDALGEPFKTAVAAAAERVSKPDYPANQMEQAGPGALLGRAGNGYGMELRLEDGIGRPHWLADGPEGIREAAYLISQRMPR